MSFSSHVTVEAEATVDEQVVDFIVQYLDFLTNDGEDAIIINFDGATNRPNAFRIAPGEVLYDVERSIKRLYYRSEAGSPSFRALGMS
jgi:hypothetical protein